MPCALARWRAWSLSATWVGGEVSFALDTFRVPLDESEEAQVEGKLDLHAVEAGIKNPLLVEIAGLVSTILDKDLPTKVRIAEQSNVGFSVRDRRVWHEGLMFMLPELSSDFVIRTSGSVGIDESLDLTVQVPDELRDKAVLAAQRRGLTLDEFIRLCLSSAVDRGQDALFSDSAVFTGDAPSDISKNHDRYLYGADS